MLDVSLFGLATLELSNYFQPIQNSEEPRVFFSLPYNIQYIEKNNTVSCKKRIVIFELPASLGKLN